MSPEALLAGGYCLVLLVCALVLEWLSAHTHRRSLRYRTAGFAYHAGEDHWTCPEGEFLLRNEFDHERRLVRYRARAHVCNRCPIKDRCTDSDDGREIVRPLDPWPHSEAGRFHRVLSLMLVVLAALVALMGLGRNHDWGEALLLGVLIVACVLAARWLMGDLRAHPANSPTPRSRLDSRSPTRTKPVSASPAHGRRKTGRRKGSDGERALRRVPPRHQVLRRSRRCHGYDLEIGEVSS